MDYEEAERLLREFQIRVTQFFAETSARRAEDVYWELHRFLQVNIDQLHIAKWAMLAAQEQQIRRQMLDVASLMITKISLDDFDAQVPAEPAQSLWERLDNEL